MLLSDEMISCFYQLLTSAMLWSWFSEVNKVLRRKKSFLLAGLNSPWVGVSCWQPWMEFCFVNQHQADLGLLWLSVGVVLAGGSGSGLAPALLPANTQLLAWTTTKSSFFTEVSGMVNYAWIYEDYLWRGGYLMENKERLFVFIFNKHEANYKLHQIKHGFPVG